MLSREEKFLSKVITYYLQFPLLTKIIRQKKKREREKYGSHKTENKTFLFAHFKLVICMVHEQKKRKKL